LRHRILFALIVELCFCFPVFADDVQVLNDLYATAVPAHVRKAFDEAADICKTAEKLKDDKYSERVLMLFDGEKHVDIFTKKFIVYEMQPNPFGGVWTLIACEGEPKPFQLWLYEIDANEWELRYIKEGSEPLDEEIARQIHGSAYSRFWL